MKINVNGKGMKVTPELESRIVDKLGKFSRIFGDEVIANVKVRPEKDQKVIEVTVKIRDHFYRAETIADDPVTALDDAVEVLEGQFRKYKTRIEKRVRDSAHLKALEKSVIPGVDEMDAEAEEEEGAEEIRITRRKSFDITPMDAEEAVLQMEMLGHNFLLYLDTETEKVCAVYKRKDGNYGLIEPNY